MVEELIEKFKTLSDEDKLNFFKAVMPSMKEILCRDPKAMMQEMMSACSQMMSGCGMDMNEMMKMMGKQEKK